MKYILVAQACNDCGGNTVVKAFSSYPTHSDIKHLQEYLGGMPCIKTKLFEAENDFGKYMEIIYHPKAETLREKMLIGGEKGTELFSTIISAAKKAIPDESTRKAFYQEVYKAFLEKD